MTTVSSLGVDRPACEDRTDYNILSRFFATKVVKLTLPWRIAAGFQPQAAPTAPYRRPRLARL